MNDDYAGLATEKTEGNPARLDAMCELDPVEERNRKLRFAAYREGHSAAIAKLARKPPHWWDDTDCIADWLRGYDDKERPLALYWVKNKDEWVPAEWDGNEWLFLGDDVGRDRVDEVGAVLEPPPMLSSPPKET